MAQGRILILGEDTQSFLTLVRALGRDGYEVHVAWCPADSPTLTSRYVHAFHAIPPYQQGDDAAWIAAFQQLFSTVHYDLVVPSTDSSALAFQLNRHHFEPRIYLHPDDVYRTCARKDETWELAASLGIPVARQRKVTSAAEALAAAAIFNYPVVLKPTASARVENPLHRQKVLKAHTDAELASLAATMCAGGTVLLQENFTGVGVGVEMLCRDGRVLQAFQHERVHEPLHGGGSSYRRSVPLDPGMFQASVALMSALNYTGVAMVEFKLNPDTGQWILIEINARFWGSLALSQAAGPNFPVQLVRLLLHGEEPPPRDYRAGIYCRHWTNDMQWFLANLRADKNDKTLQTRSYASIAAELRHILSLREYSDTFNWSDPAPAWCDLRHFLGGKFFRAAKGSAWYRSLQRRRLRRLYARARNVIVLCHGNICRSPFAEALLLRNPRLSVISRGVHPRVGRSSPPEAIAAAASFNVDLSRHSSALLTPQEIETADLILVFDRENWLSVRSIAPSHMNRVAYLGAGSPEGPLEIADPYGQDEPTFTACYLRIQDAVRRLGATSRGK